MLRQVRDRLRPPPPSLAIRSFVETCDLGPRLAGFFAFSLRSLCSCRRIRPYWGGGLRGEKSRSWRDVRPNSDWRFHPGVGLNVGRLSLRDAAFAQRDLTQTASPVSGAAGSPSGVVRLWGEN
jgi:hypothetical protein